MFIFKCFFKRKTIPWRPRFRGTIYVIYYTYKRMISQNRIVDET